MHLLHRARQCAEEIFQREMTTEVTPRQLAALMTVADHEGGNQAGLVEATGMDRSTLAEIVGRLVKRKLLLRRRARDDVRSYTIRLTGEGRRVLRTAEPLSNRVDQRILDALPTGRREQFLASLSTIS